MPTSTQIRSLLREGDRRTLGQVAEVVRQALREPKLISAVVESLFEADEQTRMRAADALEKISRERCEELQPFASALLCLLEEAEQQELRWHLAIVLPRLHLDSNELHRTTCALQRCMTAKSSIVRTFALQGLSDLTAQEPALTPLVLDLLKSAARNGTPAMKARSRKLLRMLEKHSERA